MATANQPNHPRLQFSLKFLMAIVFFSAAFFGGMVFQKRETKRLWHEMDDAKRQAQENENKIQAAKLAQMAAERARKHKVWAKAPMHATVHQRRVPPNVNDHHALRLGEHHTERVDDEASNHALFALAGLQRNMTQIRKGRYRAHGVTESPERGLKREDTIFSCFDYDAGSFRFDREENTVSGPSRGLGFKGSYTKDYMVLWAIGAEVAAIEPPSESLPVVLEPFLDVRSLGFAVHGALSERFEDCLHLQLDAPLDEAVLGEDGIYQLKWLWGTAAVFSLRIDGTKGFTPIRMRQWDSPNRHARTSSETTWVQMGDVWVPDTFRIEFRDAVGDWIESSHTLSFDWELVNEPVSDRFFSWEGLDLPRGTIVFDYRSGKDFTVE